MTEPSTLDSAISVPVSEHRALFHETAAALGARICRDALWGHGVCNWIGFSMESLGGRWRHVHRAYGGDLYSGTSGIALFLARLHVVTGERMFKRTALGAIRHALEHGAGEIAPPARIGAYSGWTGLAEAALQIGALLGDDSLRGPALALLQEAANSETGRNFDLLAGCAGAIPLLLRARAGLGGDLGPDLLAAAVRLGDHLLATAVRDGAGWSWGDFGTPGVKQKGNLLGFSHGAAGIGWALLELHHATGEARFREAGDGAFRYERHWFDAAHGNWPDLRDPEVAGLAAAADAPSFMTAWCHGAAGIGLSRLRAWQLSGDEETRKDAEVAVGTTLENLGGGTEMSQTNDSLCHGRGGNCDTLIYGAGILGRPEWLRRAEEIGLQEIEACAAQRVPWPCGTYGSVEVPGLMLGLAGIGYFYLRLADPAGTPTVLIPLPDDPLPE